jgi:hypothetical protein
MKKILKIEADLDCIVGYLRWGHLELEVDETEWNALSEEEKIDYINECGTVVVDDYSIEDRDRAVRYTVKDLENDK